MTVDLDEYKECLEKVGPELSRNIDGIVQEASRVMSPAGIKEYLDGAKGLCNLGRGNQIVISYLEEMPAVVKECGEDMIGECIESALKLSSMTSGEVIALLFASLPTAARRLGDPELLRGYLQFIHQLSAKSARGLRPMLNHTDELLSKLTLTGLKRWAFFGAEAYRRDYQNLVKYFNLETADSLKVIQKERRGTLFIDTQRKLNFYLRALWGRDFFLRPTAAEYENFKPYIEYNVLHLPDAVDPVGEISGLELYRAQAAHLASHIAYTTKAISAEQLSPAQMYFIAFMEDARVEYKAVLEFPGLKKLWKSLLEVQYECTLEHNTVSRLEQLALMLLDASVPETEDEQLNEFVKRWHAGIAEKQDDHMYSWHTGMELFHIFAERKDVPSLRILQSIRIPYRDDNRFVWEFNEFAFEQGAEYIPASQRQVRRKMSVIEMANEVDVENAGDDAQEIWTCETEMFPYEDDLENTKSFNEMWGKEPISDPFHYQEWDY
ncbi:MAG: VWA domain-containing protein, partial [Gammaproteobacteria bacterium]|nr:VWA domain-containing protein [Gammaproteobacteria bacterium]